MNLEALIFDFDGLILDTETPRFKAWRRTYRRFGGRLRPADYARNIGGDNSHSDFKKDLEQRFGRPIPWDAIDVDRRAYCGKLMGKTRPLPAVLGLIQEARRRNLKLAIASSSPSSWVLLNLERHELAEYFACVVTAENGLKAKPEPDVYREVLARIGCPGENALAFEDSPPGLLAARRADIACVVIPNNITRRLAFDRPDLMLQPRRRYGLDDIVARLEAGCRGTSRR
ncbi:MAG: HAD-IA family hydrolase [Spirochaetales bacterium]|nr:HAD-IA family hydrolase [Spirochaetales bacterium]